MSIEKQDRFAETVASLLNKIPQGDHPLLRKYLLTPQSDDGPAYIADLHLQYGERLNAVGNFVREACEHLKVDFVTLRDAILEQLMN